MQYHQRLHACTSLIIYNSGSFNTPLVCPEEQFTLECKSSLQDKSIIILEWNVYIPYLNKMYYRLHSKNGRTDNTAEEIESMVIVSFNRISESGDLPLVSQLSINNVSVNLNETKINCTERNNDNNNIIRVQTVIHIINSDFGN